MSKKTLNSEAIVSELTGASLFFQQKRPTPSSAAPSPESASNDQAKTESSVTVYSTPETKNVHSDERTSERTTVQKPFRRIIRHAFDIYADQLYALQAVQLQAVQNGRKKPKLGSMVQKAIDAYLQKQNRK